MKILFTFYPLFVNWNNGIAVLSARCKEFGVETDLYLLDDVDSFAAYLGNSDCDMVGFSSVTEHDYKLSLPFMNVANGCGKTVLVGGVYPRLGLPMHALTKYICRGEGEYLPHFLLGYDDRTFRQPLLWKDLNSLSLPDYDLFDGIPYNRELPFGGEGAVVVPYNSSRGCPARCNFCAVSIQPNLVRIRTKVEEDLNFIADKYSPDVIHFGDELVPYYSEEWRESWGNLTFPFVAYIRADISTDQLVWLVDRGMVGCFFGVESGNEQYRNDVLGKNLSDAQILRTVEVLQDAGVPYMVSYMRGMPGESWPMQSETVRMADRLGGFPVFYKYENIIGL
jgi:radical SAM superfamily enzyme YgiQ (UPF0313 family)